jgi:hypothetical protein
MGLLLVVRHTKGPRGRALSSLVFVHGIGASDRRESVEALTGRMSDRHSGLSFRACAEARLGQK